ncbi:MAG: molybdopterin-dependent oxidoreductase [Dissulfurispiraceae bacterium]
MNVVHEQPAICGLCPEGCWVRVSISGGRLLSVKSDSDPAYGNLCERGRLAPQIVYSPNRIKTPLIRTGPKGTAAFKPATWDEALEKVTDSLKNIKEINGARAVASYMGAGTLEDSLTDFYGKILAPFGSPNDIDCGSICYVSSRVLAPITTFGIHGSCISPDIDNAGVIIVWGTNPLKDGLPDKKRRIRAAQERGARIVVIDPRRSSLAKSADLWLPVRPGTDGALVLALMNVIISRDWYDKEFVSKWTIGFEALRKYAAAFSPERVSAICGIEEPVITGLAKMMSKHAPVTVDFYSGIEYAQSGTQTGRAIYSLMALLGSMDVDGGLIINEYPHHVPCEHIVDAENPALGACDHPLFYALTGKAHISGLGKAVLHGDPYPVRGLLLFGGSPMLSHTDPGMWRRVYEKLEFMLLVDRVLTTESLWADVILPATTYYEINSYQVYRKHVRLRHKIIEPVREARSDSAILAAIAERLGYGDVVPKSGRECRERAFGANSEYLARLYENLAVDLHIPQRRIRKYESGQLRTDGNEGFPTPSGKFEFASALLERYGYDPLPVYDHPYRFGEGMQLVLTTGARSKVRFNSQYLDRPELMTGNGPVLEINTVDATTRGIECGDTVTLMTEYGEIYLTAKVTRDICEGTVHAPSGGGRMHQVGSWPEANINSVIPPESKDPISGYPVLKAVPCEVRFSAGPWNASVREDALLSLLPSKT